MVEPTMNRVRLDLPRHSDQREFLGAVRRSRELHHPWVSPPSDDEMYHQYLLRNEADDFQGYLVRRVGSGDLVGVINVSNIILGSFKSAFLGFYAMEPFAGRGLMRQGLHHVLTEAFDNLGLHRVEANIQPGNRPSQSLVRRCGFRLEGLSPKYLFIDGDWRDHERWALLSEEHQHDGRFD